MCLRVEFWRIFKGLYSDFAPLSLDLHYIDKPLAAPAASKMKNVAMVDETQACVMALYKHTW
jgi:hypothetical protein